jgi:hypothetical protein
MKIFLILITSTFTLHQIPQSCRFPEYFSAHWKNGDLFGPCATASLEDRWSVITAWTIKHGGYVHPNIVYRDRKSRSVDLERYPDYSSRGTETNGGVFFKNVSVDLYADELIMKVFASLIFSMRLPLTILSSVFILIYNLNTVFYNKCKVILRLRVYTCFLFGNFSVCF